MKKIFSGMVRDFWMVILDIISVNAAYYLALIVRFYVNHKFKESVAYLLTDFATFAPYYTVLAIITFALFKLYGGLWKYAGLNDMNRVIGANLVTCVIQILGTALFIRRMPLTYYFIGAILQFFFMVLTRFGYRIILIEKKKIQNNKAVYIPAVMLGGGEKAKKVMKHIEDTAYQVTAVEDPKNAGKSLDGVPVVDDFYSVIDSVRAILIADPNLADEKREEIKKLAEAKGLDLQDYTGYFTNLSGRIPLTPLFELTRGPVTVRLENEEKKYRDGKEALKALTERYDVVSIDELNLQLTKPQETAYSGYENWAKQHKEETGEDVSFF